MSVNNWLAPLQKIADAESIDLTALAESVGASPEKFYVGRDLSRCDLRGQDLRKLDLTGATISGSLFDQHTKINPIYVDADWNLNVFKAVELSKLVYQLLTERVHAGEFASRTAALRHLVRICHRAAPDISHIVAWYHAITSEAPFREALSSSRSSRTSMTLKIYDEEHKYVLFLGRVFYGRSAGYNAAALIGTEVERGRTVSTDFLEMELDLKENKKLHP